MVRTLLALADRVMMVRAEIHYDTAAADVRHIRIRSTAVLTPIERALRRAARGGGSYVWISLIDPVELRVVYRARTKQTAAT